MGRSTKKSLQFHASWISLALSCGSIYLQLTCLSAVCLCFSKFFKSFWSWVASYTNKTWLLSVSKYTFLIQLAVIGGCYTVLSKGHSIFYIYVKFSSMQPLIANKSVVPGNRNLCHDNCRFGCATLIAYTDKAFQTTLEKVSYYRCNVYLGPQSFRVITKCLTNRNISFWHVFLITIIRISWISTWSTCILTGFWKLTHLALLKECGEFLLNTPTSMKSFLVMSYFRFVFA